MLKYTQNAPSPSWLNVVPSLTKLCLVVMTWNEQANFHQARRKGVRPSHFFSLIGSKIRKILNIARPGNYFLKKWFFKKEAKEGMFISIIWGSVVHLSLKPYQRCNKITQYQLSVISKNPIIVCSTQSECNNKHLDSFKVVNLGF